MELIALLWRHNIFVRQESCDILIRKGQFPDPHICPDLYWTMECQSRLQRLGPSLVFLWMLNYHDIVKRLQFCRYHENPTHFQIPVAVILHSTYSNMIC